MRAGADVAQGVVLGERYHLGSVIGQGGMATVYAAHDRLLDRDVAIKLFPPVAEDTDDLLRHQAEMRVLAQLSHPNLVTLHDAGATHMEGPLRQTYLVMELVPGPTLADHLQHGPLEPRHVARLGRQIAEALSTVHAADVVHRDVKPANVLLVDPEQADAPQDEGADALTTGPVVKLADFGIARLSDGARLTVTGATLGTAMYLSPEQAAGTAVGPGTDIYALGLVLLECLTGERPFTGTVVEVAAARLNAAPAMPADLAPEWAELLTDMTHREPGHRSTAADVARRLAVLGGDAMGTGEVPTLVRPAATLPAAIPPRVPVAPVRRRGDTQEPDGTQELSSELIRAEAERSAQSPRRRPSGAAPLGPASAASGSASVAGRLRRRRTALVAAVLAVVSALALVATQMADDGSTLGRTPDYPKVEGALGEALGDLQGSIEP